MENAVHARLASSSDISNAPVVVFHESLRIVDEQFLQFAPLHFRRLQINNPLHTTNHQLDQIEKRKDNSDDDQYERQRLRCIARIIKRFPPFVEAKHFATVGGREMCMCMARSVVEGGRGRGGGVWSNARSVGNNIVGVRVGVYCHAQRPEVQE